MSKTGKTGKQLTKILTYVLTVLLLLGVYGAIVYLVSEFLAPSGMYIEYNGESYFADNDGLAIEWEDGSYTAEFYVKNTEDWGIYAVSDCTVKVIPNATDNTDFDFSTENGYYAFNAVADLTAAFTKDYTSYGGDGVKVNEDGYFTLYFDTKYMYSNIDEAMSTALSRVYGEAVTVGAECDISEYPYFALQVTSPDGGSVVTIPFTVCGSGRVITVL